MFCIHSSFFFDLPFAFTHKCFLLFLASAQLFPPIRLQICCVLTIMAYNLLFPHTFLVNLLYPHAHVINCKIWETCKILSMTVTRSKTTSVTFPSWRFAALSIYLLLYIFSILQTKWFARKLHQTTKALPHHLNSGSTKKILHVQQQLCSISESGFK